MAILVLGGDDDEHAVHVLERLRDAGEDAELLDARAFPTQLALSYVPGTGDGFIVAPERRIRFSEVTAVYWRAYNEVAPPPIDDPDTAFIAHNDARSLFESLLMGLPARWVNGWDGFRLHQVKPLALSMVAKAGVPIPATLVSNDPDEVRNFAARFPRAIFKPVQGGSHTVRLGPEHLTGEHLESLAAAPGTFQEEIPGTNLRVFLAGERMHVAEIRTAATDFRDDEDAEVTPASIPADVERWCHVAAKTLALTWTGIDLRRTPEGRHVFLEANPSPMFLGFESMTGLPLTESLLALLRGR